MGRILGMWLSNPVASVLLMTTIVSANRMFDYNYLASLELCRFFHGLCQDNCTYYYRHKWGVPLCPDTNHKCCVVNLDEVEQSNSTDTGSSTTVVTTTTPTTTTTVSQLGTGECGITGATRRRKRIVGGSVAVPGRWPWMVALRSALGGHVCGGAVVGRRWVVTAAHCFKRFSSPMMWRVRTGEYHLIHTDEDERDVPVSHIHIYPEYQLSPNRSNDTNSTNRYAMYRHDIAVLELAEDLQNMPICVAQPDVDDRQENKSESRENTNIQEDPYLFMNRIEETGNCWVTGWGFTHDDANDMVMQQVQSDIVGHDECGRMWETDLDDDVICFGDGLHGPCQGDSGGPLSCQYEGKFYLTGVVSWGTQNCDLHGYPSVFTRVSAYQDWIYNVTRGAVGENYL